jgi:hypothetical protein
MNIFYLDPDPSTCAKMHLDKHVVKMIIEYAQLMSTAHRMLDGEQYIDKTANNRNIKRWRMKDELSEKTLYKASHVNHPSNIWVRQSKENYRWLYRMWFYLLQEYTYRYGKRHACEKLMGALYLDPVNIPKGIFTEPTPAMPDEYKVRNDSVTSYHNYYIHDKVRFAKWTKRQMPSWFEEGTKHANIQLSPP